MALRGDTNPFGLEDDKKKTGFDVESRVRRSTTKDQPTPVVQEVVPVRVPKVRERKTKQLRLLTYPSLVEKLDAYAEMQGLSRTEAFELAVTEFLERNT